MTPWDTIEQIEIDNASIPPRHRPMRSCSGIPIKHIMQQTVVEADPCRKRFSERLDDLLLHRRWGYNSLLAVLFLFVSKRFSDRTVPDGWYRMDLRPAQRLVGKHASANRDGATC